MCNNFIELYKKIFSDPLPYNTFYDANYFIYIYENAFYIREYSKISTDTKIQISESLFNRLKPIVKKSKIFILDMDILYKAELRNLKFEKI